MKRVLIVALALAGANLLLMGAPGYALYLAGDAPLGHWLPPFHGDETWPVAILMGLAWPVGLPLGYRLLEKHLRGRATFWPVACLLMYAWAVLLATALHWNAASVSGA